jgi:hypothetical protein
VILILESSFKELNPRRRVYVEIPKPARVELKRNLATQFMTMVDNLFIIHKGQSSFE